MKRIRDTSSPASAIAVGLFLGVGAAPASAQTDEPRTGEFCSTLIGKASAGEDSPS